MNILVVDIGGTNVKIWKTGETDKVKFSSGKDLTPQKLVDKARSLIEDEEGWHYDRVSIGYPGDVLNGLPAKDPYNLGEGWVDFDYSEAFDCPVRVMNDACMQALGSYEGGRMLYIGLGTSMGSTFIIDHQIVPLALGHLKRYTGGTFEDDLSRGGLERLGPKRWRRAVCEAATALKNAFFADYVVLGGGNVKKIKELPEGCRRGGNHNAYFGGLKMWEPEQPATPRWAVYPKEVEQVV